MNSALGMWGQPSLFPFITKAVAEDIYHLGKNYVTLYGVHTSENAPEEWNFVLYLLLHCLVGVMNIANLGHE